MIRSDELEFELEGETEYELEDELEYERSGRVPGPLRIRVVYDRSRPGSREFEYEDEVELFDPVPTPRGARLLTRFAFGRATLTAEHRRIIARLARELLRSSPRQRSQCLDVITVGHEDELGEPARFGALGQRRAQAVAAALIRQLTRLAARIPAASRPRGQFVFRVRTAGPTRPMRSNVTAQGRALNRRVEVLVGRPANCPGVIEA
jgi:outer membrane protein OmpA-like peptidoglycan-associated protein